MPARQGEACRRACQKFVAQAHLSKARTASGGGTVRGQCRYCNHCEAHVPPATLPDSGLLRRVTCSGHSLREEARRNRGSGPRRTAKGGGATTTGRKGRQTGDGNRLHARRLIPEPNMVCFSKTMCRWDQGEDNGSTWKWRRRPFVRCRPRLSSSDARPHRWPRSGKTWP